MVARFSVARLYLSVRKRFTGSFRSLDDNRLAGVKDMLVDILTELQGERRVDLAQQRCDKLTGALFDVGFDLTWPC